MGLYKEAKVILWRINCHVGWTLKLTINKKLHRQYLKGLPPMDPAYKKEVRAYWKAYGRRFDVNWHGLYAATTGIKDARIIPHDLYFADILPYMNRMKLSYGIKDKNYMDLLFPEIAQPTTIARRLKGLWMDQDYGITNREKAVEVISAQAEVIIKPTLETGGGEGIFFWKAQDGLEDLERKLDLVGEDLIVQEMIPQHQSLNRLHPDSINTLRILSFVMEGQVHILSSIVRMGINHSRVDNAHMGGICAGVRPDGRLKARAFNLQGQRFDCHPQGARFEDCLIPNFQEILDLLRVLHGRIAHFRLMSWDIAIDKDGRPILVEPNYWRGGIEVHQYNNGPLFGDLTQAVLEEVYGRKGM